MCPGGEDHHLPLPDIDLDDLPGQDDTGGPNSGDVYVYSCLYGAPLERHVLRSGFVSGPSLTALKSGLTSLLQKTHHFSGKLLRSVLL